MLTQGCQLESGRLRNQAALLGSLFQSLIIKPWLFDFFFFLAGGGEAKADLFASSTYIRECTEDSVVH